MKKFSSYYRTVIILFLAGMILVGAFNFLADPENLFGFKEINGFNNQKFRKTGNRIYCASAIMREKYDVVIFGTSTIRRLDESHPAFKSDSAFKLMTMGANFYEIHQIFEFTRSRQKLSAALISLDFYAFSNYKTVSGDFADSYFSGKNPYQIKFNYLFSYTILSESVKTVIDSYRDARKSPGSAKLPEQATPKPALDQRENFNMILAQSFMVHPDEYAAYRYGEDRILLLQKIMEECRADGIRLHLYVSPIHARQLAAIHALGLWPSYERWLRDLAKISEQNNRAHPDQPAIEMWDFTGYNAVTTEEIPPLGNTALQMKWWGDSVHFGKDLGDIIIDTVMHYQEPGRTRPADFGMIINSDNIESHLEDLRAGQKQYRETHAREVEEVENIALLTRRFRAPDFPLILTFKH